MKKHISMLVTAAVVLGCANLAFAASSSFNDVPAKHWAYAAVTDLAKAGIIEGYGDGTFRGDRQVSRYELAIMVQKAMTKYDKANAKQQAEIDLLSAEFATELNKMDARVTKLEKNASTTKVHGELRTRYEWSKAGISGALKGAGLAPAQGQFRIRARLLVDGQIADGVMYHANYESENFTGIDTGFPGSKANLTDNKADLVVGFVDAKTGFGYAHVGRMGMGLGYGLLTGSPKWDGIRVGGGKDVKWMIGTAKRNGGENGIEANGNTWDFGQIGTNIGKVNVFAAYLGEVDKTNYNSMAAGLSFKAGSGVKISGEYANNNATDTNAWYAKAQYKGADPKKEGSFGLWAQYKKAENGFDKYGMADPYTMSMPWTANYPSPGGNANNLKGTEFGIDYTVFKNGVLSVKYDALKSNDGKNTDRKFMITELNVSF